MAATQKPSSEACERAEQPEVGYVIHWANRVFTRELDAQLRPLGVTSAQLGPLIILSRTAQPMLQRDVVRESAIAQPAMVSAIGLLLKRGFIIQRRHDQDGRATALELTPRGRDVVDRAIPVLARCNARAVAGLSAREQAELVRLTRAVIANMKADAPAAP